MDEKNEAVEWMRAAPGRHLEQVIDPVPGGISVTTRWMDGQELFRQDCAIELDSVTMDGQAADLGG